MAGTTSSIISNLLSFLERLSPFIPTFTSLVASSSSPSSSIAREDVTAAQVDIIQERFIEDLSRLLRMLRRTQAVLHDAEEREIYDKAIQFWLSELREVAYEAEDVLAQYDYKVIKTQVEGITTTKETIPSLKSKRVDDDDDIYVYQVSLHSSNSIKIPICCDMAMRIIEIIKKFDEIANDRKALKLREEEAPRWPYFNDVMRRPQSSSLVYESDVVGREEEKTRIIQLLMSHSEMENIVIPIVGMGGVGKTTLAQLVYNDPMVCQHFSPKVWVCVSEEFDVLRVTKEILTSIMGSSIHHDNNNLNDLQCTLKEALLNKKFLLILDDVWNERPDMWEALQAPFSSIGMGKIIVTTRSMSVADITQTVSSLKLECLNTDKSWLLFKRHAFAGWEPNKQLNFEKFGKGITMKCGGLPLALKAIGGFLRYEFKEHKWENVLNNLWELEGAENHIMSTLRISYNYLPAHLKACFLFASMFPKDYLFEKSDLIKMWIAQGYVQVTKRNRLLEDIAFDFLEDLERRSFFQCTNNGERFTLHDMMHELAQSITRNEICTLLDFDELKNIPKNPKHIFIQDTKVDLALLPVAIRTLYSFSSYHLFRVLHQSVFPKDLFSRLSYLRVLKFHAPNFECNFQFIDLISNLQLLHYLFIQVRKVQMRNNSFCSLYKLQVLILQSFHINMLPHAIGKLTYLRHLMIYCKTLEMSPQLSFWTKNLLTFNFNICCNDNERVSKFLSSNYHLTRDGPYSSIGWLEQLTNLRGSLEIYRLENVIDREDAKRANLQSKPHVEKLSLSWMNSRNDECVMKAILDGLQPHTNLKELIISGYGGSSFPSWFGSPRFSNLTKVKLKYFNNKAECQSLPIATLPSLKSLEIWCFDGIRRMGHDFWCYNAPPNSHENYSTEVHAGFHSPEYPTNKSMTDWKLCPTIKNGEFLSLKFLGINFCHELQQITTLPSSLEKFFVRGCERLEYIALCYNSRPLSKLQIVDILGCRNLKSMINLNNLLGTLKVLKLIGCDQLKLNPNENFDHSIGSFPVEKCTACVINCPRMREWCQWHGFTYEDKAWQEALLIWGALPTFL